ncbi:hypothetical protein MP228_007986 [Amoeboaphelidium protococcarum]|nr:hypothetical protein MP228_007986 [Amoeboaphelidium protococcarum]
MSRVKDQVDVTELLTEACYLLNDGELLHIKEFELKEAIGAIELMDPRMDSGMALVDYFDNNGNNLALGDQVPQNWTEFISFAVQMERCFASWLGGQPLPQNVLTCTLVHDRTLILRCQDDVLCLCLTLFLDVVELLISQAIDLLQFAAVIYEEDVIINLFSVKLMQFDIAVLEIRFQNITRVLQAQNDPQSDIAYHHLALWFRFLQILSNMVDSKQFMQTSAEQFELDFERLLLHLTAVKDRQTDVSLQQQVKGFDQIWSAKLISNLPPRTNNLPAVGMFQTFIEQFVSCTKEWLVFVTQSTEQSKIEEVIAKLLLRLRNARNSPVDPITKSLIKLWLVDNTTLPTGVSLKTIILNDIMSSAGIKFEQLQQSSELLSFKNRLVLMVSDLVRVLLYNKARVHRALPKMVKLIDALQVQGEMIDQKYFRGQSIQYPFGQWLLCLKLELMIEYLFLGFDLELYQINELSFVYWYIGVLLHHQTDLVSKAIQLKQQVPEATATNALYNHADIMFKKDLCLGYSYLLSQSSQISGKWQQQRQNSIIQYRFGAFESLSSPPFMTLAMYHNQMMAGGTERRHQSKLIETAQKFFISAKMVAKSPRLQKEKCIEYFKLAFSNEILCNLMLQNHTEVDSIDLNRLILCQDLSQRLIKLTLNKA